ncbi:MAG: hypothetical protein PVF54_01885 [Anaerolineae bacterium]|jgi:hypothetical protein
MVKTVCYRVEQFLRALTAEQAISEQRFGHAAKTLPQRARALFVRQTLGDQRHALAVYERLLQQGHTRGDLLAAALLHDVGKAAAQLSTWERGLLVLAERFAPRAVESAVGGPAQRWRARLVAYAQHAEIGARWAEDAGCSALTAELIRRHERRPRTPETEEDRLLAALQAADSLN